MRPYAAVLSALAVLALVPCAAKAESFTVPNSDCLVSDCHGTAAVYDRLNIAKNFDFDASFAQNDGVLSQHNVQYAQDGNFGTIEALNGCKVCHVADPTRPNAHRYVAAATILAYPDAYGGHTAGELIGRTTDFSRYQDFCLSCHDGAGANMTLPAALPASGQQVAPSSRGDPAALQTAPPWVVPSVPPKDFNAGATYANAAPFFDYYETNGHGRDTTTLTNSPMNVTCVAGGDGQGCHNPHGATNRYLIDDSFGTGVDTASEVATVLCHSCHAEGGNFALPNGGASTFHGWDGVVGDILHDRNVGHFLAGQETVLGDPIDGMSQWSVFAQTAPNGSRIVYDLNISGSPLPQLGLLPFYGAPGGAAHSRSYPTTALTSANWVHCLTCHDPHGTGAGTVPAMLRIAYDPADFTETDPLCKQCHKN